MLSNQTIFRSQKEGNLQIQEGGVPDKHSFF